ncbi:MAG: DUF47 family protein [Thermotogota bacterium]
MSLWGRVFQKFNPIHEIIQHARVVEHASDYLPSLFYKYLNGEDITQMVSEIDKLEDDADDIKNNIRKNLKKGYMYRFERVDLLNFIEIQDKIADKIEDLAKMMTLNKVELEDSSKDKILAIVNEVENMLDLFKGSVKYLNKIIDSDFSKDTIQHEENDITEMKWFEKDIDEKIFDFGRWIYQQKNTMNPIDLLFLRKLVLSLSDIADLSQNVTDRIHILINE